MPTTYYVTWPDKVTTLIVVGNDSDGQAAIKIVGRRERFDKILGGKVFPTAESAIQLLAKKVGVTVKKRAQG